MGNEDFIDAVTRDQSCLSPWWIAIPCLVQFQETLDRKTSAEGEEGQVNLEYKAASSSTQKLTSKSTHLENVL